VIKACLEFADIAAFKTFRPVRFQADILRNARSLPDGIQIECDAHLGGVAVLDFDNVEAIDLDAGITMLQQRCQPLRGDFVQVAGQAALTGRVGTIARIIHYRFLKVAHTLSVSTSGINTSGRLSFDVQSNLSRVARPASRSGLAMAPPFHGPTR